MFNTLTLLTNIFHSSNELLLEVLAVFGDLLTLLQKVLGRLLNRHCQNMGLLGTSLLLTGWPFVAGVHQGGHLGKRRGRYHWLKNIQHVKHKHKGDKLKLACTATVLSWLSGHGTMEVSQWCQDQQNDRSNTSESRKWYKSRNMLDYSFQFSKLSLQNYVV